MAPLQKFKANLLKVHKKKAISKRGNKPIFKSVHHKMIYKKIFEVVIDNNENLIRSRLRVLHIQNTSTPHNTIFTSGIYSL